MLSRTPRFNAGMFVCVEYFLFAGIRTHTFSFENHKDSSVNGTNGISSSLTVSLSLEVDFRGIPPKLTGI